MDAASKLRASLLSFRARSKIFLFRPLTSRIEKVGWANWTLNGAHSTAKPQHGNNVGAPFRKEKE